jgi:hypothetical protein
LLRLCPFFRRLNRLGLNLGQNNKPAKNMSSPILVVLSNVMS